MELIKNIKEKLGWFILNKRMEKDSRNRDFYNFETAQNIGIIFNATQLDTYEATKAFVDSLAKQKKKVYALGFVDSKGILDYYVGRKGFNFFSRKNQNWYGKPKNPVVDSFIEKDFDILIDLSLKTYYPIQYIVGLSEARFKVGRYIDNQSFYDLMISITDKDTLPSFIEHVMHYVSAINKPQ